MSQTQISKLSQKNLPEFIELLKVFEVVFEMENFTLPDNSQLEKILANPQFVVFTASADGQIVGGITGYILDSYYANSSQVYIYDLAVKTDFQRQGIGQKLMEEILNFARSLGSNEVFVQADLEDAHALDFYRATGGKATDVVHFTYKIKN